MARETITDLLYQYIRAVVTAGFRDGMLSGVREAMGLPAPEAEQEGGVPGRKNPGTTPPETRREKSLPRPSRNIPPALAGPAPGEAQDLRRGRGRPRKYPPSASPPAPQQQPQKQTPQPSGEKENPPEEKAS